jgi:phage terminase large subunit
MRAVAQHPLVAVKACHASGKTFVAARLALWWLVRWLERGRVRVITTAPTLRQTKLMFEEIRTAVEASRIAFPECGSLALRISDDCYAMGFSSAKGVNAQGFHGDHVLIIADEAPGIESEVWDAIEGIRAGGDVRILMLGNPVVPSGVFFDAFTRERMAWQRFTISALDTPNLAGLNLDAIAGMDANALMIAPKPYLVTRAWVREKMQRWGVNHPKFRSRVLGEFPKQSDTPSSIWNGSRRRSGSRPHRNWQKPPDISSRSGSTWRVPARTKPL